MRRNELFLLLLFCILSVNSSSNEPAEKQLADFLFTNYNPNVRPSRDPTESLTVNVHLHIEAITEVNDKDETITISAWIEMSWNDSGLCWDPASFGDILDTVVPAEKVWKPDLAFNTVVSERFFSAKDVPAIIDNSCMVYFAPGGVWTHNCDLKMTTFPFDTQECQFTIITWYSAAKKITLAASNFTIGTKENDMWKKINARYEVQNDGQEFPTQAIFTLKIKRKPFYFVLYVIIPLIMVSFLNLMVFRQPAEAGEKVSLSISVLLAFSIWLLMLNDITPRSSDTIPMLAVLITMLMGLSTFSALVTVCVVRIHHYEDKLPLPPWAVKLLEFSKMKMKCWKKTDQGDYSSGDHSKSTWQAVAAAIDYVTFRVALTINCLTIFISFLCFVSL